MKPDKKLFRETSIYPIFFMIIITILFVGVLSFFYNSQKGRIDDNLKISYYRNILEIFNDKITEVDFAALSDEEVLLNVEKYLVENALTTEKGKRTYYKVNADFNVIGYCFDIVGSGLWGTMRAVVGFDPDLTTLIDFNVYEQVETPGLGGRIGEPADKLKLRADLKGSAFVTDDKITDYKLISEGATPAKGNEIRQITGATITSSSFLKMLHQEMVILLPLVQQEMAKGE